MVARAVFWPPLFVATCKENDVYVWRGERSGAIFWCQIWTSFLPFSCAVFGALKWTNLEAHEESPKQLCYAPGAPFYDSKIGPPNWPPEVSFLNENQRIDITGIRSVDHGAFYTIISRNRMAQFLMFVPACIAREGTARMSKSHSSTQKGPPHILLPRLDHVAWLAKQRRKRLPHIALPIWTGLLCEQSNTENVYFIPSHQFRLNCFAR